MTDFVENRIYSNTYDLFDRALYGGIGHGVIVFPTHIIKVIFTVLFPPIGELLNVVEDYLLNNFPYITWDVIKQILDPKNFNRIIYSYVLTSLFYVPGLVYTLAKLTIKSSGIKGSIVCDPNTGVCTDAAEFSKSAEKISL